MRLSTLTAALSALLVISPMALAQPGTGQTITTSTLSTQVFSNGSVQGDCATAPLFVFNGTEGGCGAAFMLGISASNVIGRAYNRAAASAPSGWTAGTIGASTDFPYPTLTSGVKTTFSSLANNVSVEGNHYYSEANPDYIVHQYKITNTGTAALTNVYPGFYADYDVAGAAAATNLGGYDATTQTLYTYHNAANPYYGVTALTGTVSGYKYMVAYPAAPSPEESSAELYQGLTTMEGPIGAAADQRGPIGVGPLTIPAGATVTVAFASVAGTNQADLLANAADARSLSTGPVTIASSINDTGTAQLRVFNNGYFGADVGVPTDVTFNFGGGSPLYEGQLIVALSATQISGQPYSSSPQGPTAGQQDWTPRSGPTAVTATPPFTQAFRVSYTDDGTSNADPAGLTVSQTSSSRTGDDFVVVDLVVTNNGTAARSGVYIGMFSDFDISPTAVLDVGAFDAATQTVYTRSIATTGNTNVYGVSLLGMMASGWNVSSATTTPAGIYAGLTQPGTAATTGGDRRNLIGAGPFSLAIGASQRVRFAYVAGTDVADLLANAAVARGLFVAGEDGPGAQTERALGMPFPNPSTGEAQLALTVAQGQAVQVGLYDALGRRVAVLFDGTVQAGSAETLRVDGRALPAGVYVVRAEGETFSESRRLVLTR